VAAAGFGAVWWNLRTLVAAREVAELGRVAGFAATQLERRLSAVLRGAGHLGEGTAGEAPAGAGIPGAALDAFRAEHGGLVAAVVVSDATGAVTAVSPYGWAGAATVAASEVARSAIRLHAAVVAPEPVAVQSRRLLQVAAPLAAPRGGAGRAVAVLSLVIDAEALETQLLAPLRVEEGDIAVLLAAAGRPVAAVGPVEVLRRFEGPAMPDGIPGAAGADRVLGGAALLAGKAAPVAVADQTWRLVTLRPRASALRGLKPLLLLCVLFAGFALAAGWATVAGLRQVEAGLDEARRDASHWRAVAAEARREDRWQILAEEAHEPIVLLDGTRVVSGNRGAGEALDLEERQALVARDFLDFVAVDDREVVGRRIAGATGASPGSSGVRTRLVTARGRQRIVDLVVSPIETAGGLLVRASWQDLTSRERAEALLRAVVRSAPFSVVLTDREGCLIWANQTFVDACHYPAERFVGHELLPIVDPRDRRRARVLIARAVRGMQAESVLHMRRTDGELIAVAVRATSVVVGSELYGIILIGFDAAAAPAFAGWERIPDGVLLAQLGTLLAHRLSNDLQGLVGVVEHLEGVPDLTAEARRLVGNATRQLQQFSVLSRSGTASLHPLSLGALVEGWRQRVEPGLPRGVRLVTRGAVEDDTVTADGGQITLLLDLAVAAAVPSLSGGGTFEVEVGPSPRPGSLRLSLFDTGPGTPEDADATARPPLPVRPARDMVRAVARLVARHHGGMTGFKSTVGIGNRLWCDLLISGEPAPPAPLVRTPSEGAVLVADDEELVRRTLADCLRERGHQVVEAGNGAEVVKLVLSEPGRFALVVLDLVMPVLDGREALREIRASLPSLPVLVCTGYDPTGDPVLATAEVMIKPFGIDEFLAKVGELLVQPGRTGGDGGTMHA